MILSKKMFLILILVLLILGILFWRFFSRNIEKPSYDVITSNKSIEFRLYKPMLIAEVIETGDRRATISKGFRVLADYIFGNNTTRKKIEMTAPVSQTKSEKIKMTAPVIQEASIKNTWKIQFVMPKTHQLDTLPKPNDKRIKIKQIPEEKRIVIRFSGHANDVQIEHKKKALLQYIKANNLKVSSSISYAFYNPPWTPSFLRRNEIMMVVE